MRQEKYHSLRPRLMDDFNPLSSHHLLLTTLHKLVNTHRSGTLHVCPVPWLDNRSREGLKWLRSSYSVRNFHFYCLSVDSRAKAFDFLAEIWRLQDLFSSFVEPSSSERARFLSGTIRGATLASRCSKDAEFSEESRQTGAGISRATRGVPGLSKKKKKAGLRDIQGGIYH